MADLTAPTVETADIAAPGAVETSLDPRDTDTLDTLDSRSDALEDLDIDTPGTFDTPGTLDVDTPNTLDIDTSDALDTPDADIDTPGTLDTDHPDTNTPDAHNTSLKRKHSDDATKGAPKQQRWAVDSLGVGWYWICDIKNDVFDQRSAVAAMNTEPEVHDEKWLTSNNDTVMLAELPRTYIIEPTAYYQAFTQIKREPSLPFFHQAPPPSYPFTVAITRRIAHEMAEADYQQCFKLVERTSRRDYHNSDVGWHPDAKMKEMQDANMIYLLIQRAVPEPTAAPIIGFLSFMPTWEHLDKPEVPCLYIYEVHLAEEARGSGLGRHLLDLVELAAYQKGIILVMLTVFRRNEGALKLYQRQGYREDPQTPAGKRMRSGGVVASSYVIMSKRLSLL
jgi:ribosomal protein S18 acetylase RimI-like enzyme